MPNKTTIYRIAAFLFTAGAAIVALQQTGWIPTYDTELKIIGAITICGGLIFVTVAFVSTAQPMLNSLVFHMRGQVAYIRELAEINDLNMLFTHYEKIFGNDLIPQDEFTKWMVKNPTICHKVSRVKSHNEQSRAQITGFFDFEPLTSHAHKRLVNGAIEGWGLSSKDILSPRTTRTPKSYYIGSVGTTSGSQNDRAATLLCALEHVKRLNLLNVPESSRACQYMARATASMMWTSWADSLPSTRSFPFFRLNWRGTKVSSELFIRSRPPSVPRRSPSERIRRSACPSPTPAISP